MKRTVNHRRTNPSRAAKNTRRGAHCLDSIRNRLNDAFTDRAFHAHEMQCKIQRHMHERLALGTRFRVLRETGNLITVSVRGSEFEIDKKTFEEGILIAPIFYLKRELLEKHWWSYGSKRVGLYMRDKPANEWMRPSALKYFARASAYDDFTETRDSSKRLYSRCNIGGCETLNDANTVDVFDNLRKEISRIQQRSDPNFHPSKHSGCKVMEDSLVVDYSIQQPAQQEEVDMDLVEEQKRAAAMDLHASNMDRQVDDAMRNREISCLRKQANDIKKGFKSLSGIQGSDAEQRRNGLKLEADWLARRLADLSTTTSTTGPPKSRKASAYVASSSSADPPARRQPSARAVIEEDPDLVDPLAAIVCDLDQYIRQFA